MNIKILDKRDFGAHQWFLGRISLWDYLSAVTTKSFEFDIQRGVVKNKYLDTILQSIKLKEPIPPLTITTSDVQIVSNSAVNINEFDILDGLQRTYRLWVYKQIADNSIAHQGLFGLEYNIVENITRIKEANFLMPGIISITQIKKLFNTKESINVQSIKDLYTNFDIFLYVWKGLNEEEVVRKMLILNAGQRKVSISHQYELMFLRIFREQNNIGKIKLIREKDDEFGAVRTGKREIGQFVFSTIVIGLQSLIERKPMRLSPDNLDDDYISEETTVKFFNQPFLNSYLERLYELDELLCGIDDKYKRWFVKDTTISGIMGAIGSQLSLEMSDYADNFTLKFIDLKKKLGLNNYFKIDCFYKEYDNLSSTKINIGDKVREAICEYTKAILAGSPISWQIAFIPKEEV